MTKYNEDIFKKDPLLECALTCAFCSSIISANYPSLSPYRLTEMWFLLLFENQIWFYVSIKYAGTSENCNIVIAVIFYPVNQSIWNFVCILFGFVSTQIQNLRVNGNFANVFEIFWNLGFNLRFRRF